MNDKNIHTDHLSDRDKRFFGQGKIAWEKSEADVWAELEPKMDKAPMGRSVSMLAKVARWSAAAVIVLLVGLSALAFFYTKTVETAPGEHLVAQLPDGSTVELNAGSRLTYHPLKWRFKRQLKFEGEGLFKVEKGKTFEVESANGVTRVLGTSFNIYARDDQYRVTCLTGKVEVESPDKEKALLLPDTHAELKEGKLVVKQKYRTEKALGWKTNQFFFEGRPLKEVIDEIERQYAVTIRLQPNLNDRNFASNFSKKYNVEEVLDFICKSMQIKFEKQSENVYLIQEKS